MNELQGPPRTVESQEPAQRQVRAQFALGFVIGLFGAIIPAAVLGFFVGAGKYWETHRSISCIVEFAGFGLLLLWAIRSRKRGLAQGLLVGGAVAFLLCAACWGLMILWK